MNTALTGKIGTNSRAQNGRRSPSFGGVWAAARFAHGPGARHPTPAVAQALPTASPRSAGARAAALCCPEHRFRSQIGCCTSAGAARLRGQLPRRSSAGALLFIVGDAHAACRTQFATAEDLASWGSCRCPDQSLRTLAPFSRPRRPRGAPQPCPWVATR